MAFLPEVCVWANRKCTHVAFARRRSFFLFYFRFAFQFDNDGCTLDGRYRTKARFAACASIMFTGGVFSIIINIVYPPIHILRLSTAPTPTPRAKCFVYNFHFTQVMLYARET